MPGFRIFTKLLNWHDITLEQMRTNVLTHNESFSTLSHSNYIRFLYNTRIIFKLIINYIFIHLFSYVVNLHCTVSYFLFFMLYSGLLCDPAYSICLSLLLEHMNLPNEEQQRIFLFYSILFLFVHNIRIKKQKQKKTQWVNIISSLTHTLIADFHKAGNGYTKLSQLFQVPKAGGRRIIKKFKESWKYWTNYWEMGLKTPKDSSEWLRQVGNCSLKEENHKNPKQE